MPQIEEELQTFIDKMREKYGDIPVLEAMDAVQTGLQMIVDEEGESDD